MCIVNILSKSCEETLKIILDQKIENYKLTLDGHDLPVYIQSKIKVVLEELKQFDYIAQCVPWMGKKYTITITPYAITYFEDKDKYLKKQQEIEKIEKEKTAMKIKIDNLNNQGGVLAFGNMINPNINIDNSIESIKKCIEEKGGEDKQKLLAILEQAKEIVDNIESSKQIPQKPSFFEQASVHFVKHQWFYSAIIDLLGKAVLNKTQG